MIGYSRCLMRYVATERAQQALNPTGGCGESAENAKRMLFRGNEAKNLLKTKELVFQDHKTNCFLIAKTANQSEKYDQKWTACGASSETRNWKLENGAASFQFLTSSFYFPVRPHMHAFASMSRNHAAQTLTLRTVVVIHLIRRRRQATEATGLGTVSHRQ